MSGITGPTGPTGFLGSICIITFSGSTGITGPTGTSGIQGYRGLTGLTGFTGFDGPMGATGLQGVTGASGLTGITGSTGLQGFQGFTGTTGPQGLTGPTGTTGSQGFVGLTGSTGPQGIQGLTGTTGLQGLAGITGITGPQGDQGIIGTTGPQGDQGPTGTTGTQGLQGITGTTGSQGSQGLTGTTGPQGYGGITGTTGPQGTQIAGTTGPQGLQGLTGPTGIQGFTGVTGTTGTQGLQGFTGVTGPQGILGLTGTTGSTGSIGPQGILGTTGATGITGRTGTQGLTGIQGVTGNLGTSGDAPTGPQGTRPTAVTGAQGRSIFPPFPNDDIVSLRPNQPVTVNVVTGISTNLGFGPTAPTGATGSTGISGLPDSSGSDLSGNTIFPIISVTTVKTTPNGTLTQIGTTGLYSYTPNSRFVGTDEFIYSVTDSSGNNSKTTAMGVFNVVSVAPTGVGPRFIYSDLSTPGHVYQYTGIGNGVSTEILLFTSTVGSTNIDALATNRDDSLIYFCDNSGADANAIYAYDYIAGVQFLVISATTLIGFQNNYFSVIGPLRITTPGSNPNSSINFQTGGATYYNGILYLAGNGKTYGYYRIAVAPYVAGSFQQTITSVSYIQWSDGIARDMGDITYSHKANSLIVTWIDDGSPDISYVSVIDPINGQVVSTYPIDSSTGTSGLQSAEGPDGVCYAVFSTPLNVHILNLTDGGTSGTTINAGAYDIPTNYTVQNEVNDMAEWISQPVPL